MINLNCKLFHKLKYFKGYLAVAVNFFIGKIRLRSVSIKFVLVLFIKCCNFFVNNLWWQFFKFRFFLLFKLLRRNSIDLALRTICPEEFSFFFKIQNAFHSFKSQTFWRFQRLNPVFKDSMKLVLILLLRTLLIGGLSRTIFVYFNQIKFLGPLIRIW